jgi:hypothetical protein
LGKVDHENRKNPLVRDYLNSTVHFNLTQYQFVTQYGNAFLSGMDANAFSSNVSNCFNAWVDFYYKELPLMDIRYYYGDTDDIIFNTTKLVLNITKHLAVCTDMADGFYQFAQSQMTQFASVANYFLSFF